MYYLRCRIFWKSIDDWAAEVYKFASESGWIGGVYTISELSEGEDTLGCSKNVVHVMLFLGAKLMFLYLFTGFHGLDAEILRKALRVLESDGRVRITEIICIFIAHTYFDLKPGSDFYSWGYRRWNQVFRF